MMIECNNPIFDWLFPRRCFTCNEDIEKNSLCNGCRSLCTPCREGLSTTRSGDLALFYYEFTVKRLIRAAKYKRKPAFVHALCELIKEEIEHSLSFIKIRDFSPTAITYVPTHRLNRIVRGVELQVLYADILSKMLNIPLVPTLVRTRFFHRQALKSNRNERLLSINGSFRLKKDTVGFKRLLLVDDIVTTGATFDYTKKVLETISPKILTSAIAKTP